MSIKLEWQSNDHDLTCDFCQRNEKWIKIMISDNLAEKTRGLGVICESCYVKETCE